MSTVILGASMKNGDALVRRLAEAFEDWAREDIDDAYWDDQFKDMGLWRYERETRRKNGEVVYSPRDIYDTGALYQSGRDSFRMSSSPNQVAANWAWDAVGSNGYHYARDVHEGEGSSEGFPRKWTDELAVPQKFDASMVKQALLLKINAAMNRR